jgi:hypothetical protein
MGRSPAAYGPLARRLPGPCLCSHMLAASALHVSSAFSHQHMRERGLLVPCLTVTSAAPCR